MSFYTSLTGLNAATAQLGVTSNNIANVGTTGFKRSRADFGDIFATSPLQKASSSVGQGVSLKQVTQEFNQGNISFSSNALDLAITGDGFFPMRTADGLQDIYTRNGSFMLNEQFNVVNSAGQRLMAATVDSTGSANVNERVVLNIPQKTSGEAKQTTTVNLGLNFPSDAQVITEPFNRNNPATYNKSTALTVYDTGGNGYLATIYYVKTQNASQSKPTNKWQTHVFVGDDQASFALQQATDSNGENLYVNQYGELKPYSEVKDDITLDKTMLFALDELTDQRISVPASLSGSAETTKSLISASSNFSTGLDFGAIDPTSELYTSLGAAFNISVDGSEVYTPNLQYLVDQGRTLDGTEMAAELTNLLQREFGSQSAFVDNGGGTSFTVTTTTATGDVEEYDISVAGMFDKTSPTIDDLIAEIKSQIQDADYTGPALLVGYDYATQRLSIKLDPEGAGYNKSTTLKLSSDTGNILNIPTTPTLLNSKGELEEFNLIPNGESIRDIADQRYGMKVTYDVINGIFKFQSGTTGDNSSLSLSLTQVDGADDPLMVQMFGLHSDSTYTISTSDVALRGTASAPAVAYGDVASVFSTNSFEVNDTNNTFLVTVDGVKGTVILPTGNNYTLDTFLERLQKGINSLTGNNADNLASGAEIPGSTPDTVNGVTVSYDQINGRLKFSTGTTGTDAYIKISGDAFWGLENVEAGRGSVSTWIKPTQHKDVVGGNLQAKYIDSAGNETTSPEGFTGLPPWSPVFLQKGQLTFDTGGKLVSPLKGTQLETVYLAGGKGALTINVNYAGSTQYQSSFAVLSQSQDGAPEGDLVGVTIGNDGLVSASFSNGTQKSLAKILLANFSSPSGLRQIGDSSFLASSASGKATLGTAGSAGFGTLRAGATERSNVDLTNELVDLITAQRNFQANAKAIETSSTMTSAIINMRS